MEFAVPADLRVKLKESEKKDKHWDFAWQLKKLLNMKVTYIPIEIGALDTKGLVKELQNLEIRGRVESIHTKALCDRLEYGEESWRRRDLLSLKLQWETISVRFWEKF